MKINLISFGQNRIYKKQENKKNPIEEVSSKSDFSILQNILSNYSKAIISFGAKKVNEDELKKYMIQHPNENQKQIANYFGVTKACIGQSIKKFNIPYQNKRKINISTEQIQSYIKTHKKANLDEIAEHFGVSKQFVSAMIIENNIEYHRKSRQATIPIQEIKDYILDNPQATQEEIAEYFNISQTYVSKLIIKYKLPYISKKD